MAIDTTSTLEQGQILHGYMLFDMTSGDRVIHYHELDAKQHLRNRKQFMPKHNMRIFHIDIKVNREI